MKNCSSKNCECVNPQSFSEFRDQKGRKYGKKSQCKTCEKRYYDARKDIDSLKSRVWYRENKYRQKMYKVKKQYGLDSKEYERMMEETKGECFICKRASNLVVDHCHASLRVRGLICNNCNRGLGYFKDSVGFLESAISYLNKS